MIFAFYFEPIGRSKKNIPNNWSSSKIKQNAQLWYQVKFDTTINLPPMVCYKLYLIIFVAQTYEISIWGEANMWKD